MFGFLKKKLGEAVKRFGKQAEEEVVEEPVDEAAAIEAAKEEERELLEEPVEEIPETAAEREQHAKERADAAGKAAAAPEGAAATRERPGAAPGTTREKGEAEATPAAPAEAPAATPEEAAAAEASAAGTASRKETAEAAPGKGADASAARTATEKEASEKRPRGGLFRRVAERFTKRTLSAERFEELFFELEVALLESNVAVEVIEKLKEDLKRDLTQGKVSRLGLQEQILLSLKRSVREVLSVEGFDLVGRIKGSGKRPYVIAFIGVNGSGKTTTLAKVANTFQEEGLGVVLAASDTFRAAAIDQLKEHADKLGVKLVSQGYGADPAAVAYDAVEHARAKGQEVVMIDTAGRLHSNANLMAELEKVVRVAKPDLKIFIGESTTGNDCVEQAKEFDRRVGIDAIILSKADVDEKGGAAVSVSYVTKRPILYLGVGQAYGDLKPFDKEEMVKSLGL